MSEFRAYLTGLEHCRRFFICNDRRMNSILVLVDDDVVVVVVLLLTFAQRGLARRQLSSERRKNMSARTRTRARARSSRVDMFCEMSRATIRRANEREKEETERRGENREERS